MKNDGKIESEETCTCGQVGKAVALARRSRSSNLVRGTKKFEMKRTQQNWFNNDCSFQPRYGTFFVLMV